MLLRARCAIQFTNTPPVTMVLMLRPQSGEGQWVRAVSYHVTPRTPVIEYADVFGNFCQRLSSTAQSLSVEMTCDVEVADEVDAALGLPASPVETFPTSALQFLLPSRYCESDKLVDLANEVVQQVSPGYDQAEAVRRWVHNNVTYQPGFTTASTSAVDVVANRQGVCRDQAHVTIALCRALSIPARMVVGFLHGLQPMDLHAWVECYVADRWWTFDPKEPITRGGRVVIAYGRDAADVAFATQFGESQLDDLTVEVERIE